jgi:hypothetical protein
MTAINSGSSLLAAAPSAATWPFDDGSQLLTDANAAVCRTVTFKTDAGLSVRDLADVGRQ